MGMPGASGPASQGPWCGTCPWRASSQATRGVRASCCAWKKDKCDSCKCDKGQLFEAWCHAGCGEECCSWQCDVVTGVLCGCGWRGRARHCDHGSELSAPQDVSVEVV